MTVLDDIRSEAFDKVNWHYAEVLAEVTGDASPEERDTWAPKLYAASMLLSGNATDSQAFMISAEATGAGVTAPEMAMAIIGKGQEYEATVGVLSGQLQAHLRMIAGAESEEAITTISEGARDAMLGAVAQLKAAQS